MVALARAVIFCDARDKSELGAVSSSSFVVLIINLLSADSRLMQSVSSAAWARLVIFCEFIFRGVDPIVTSARFALILEVASVVFAI